MIKVETMTDEELWRSGVPSSIEAIAGEEPGPVVVAHVVDFYNRYPGEPVIFFTRVDVREPLSDLTLRISLPERLVLNSYQAPPELNGLIPVTEVDGDVNYLVWFLEGELPAGSGYEYQAEGSLAATQQDTKLESRAVVATGDHTILAEETVTIAVRARGRYLQHLPAIYEQDELMGRLLMLFESFWAPIEIQTGNMHHYFDPRLTPANFLPWLASWLDLELVDGWPEERLRQLTRWAIALHRSRGTKWGLLKYLEIYTGQKAKITERRAKNFVLGRQARLGPGIALGRGNRPHTFVVTLRLPPIDAEDEEARARQEKIDRRAIEAIIEMQKPAHTTYTLLLKTSSPTGLETQADQTEVKADEAAQEVDEITAQAAIWFKLVG